MLGPGNMPVFQRDGKTTHLPSLQPPTKVGVKQFAFFKTSSAPGLLMEATQQLAAWTS